MLTADLSRRVARAMQAPVDSAVDTGRRFDVMRDLITSNASKFDELPKTVQQFVLDAEAEINALTAAGDFDEAKHPRDSKGKFAKKAGGGAGKKLKITHMLVHKSHGQAGDVLTENGAGTKRVVWDGKEYRLQRKKDDGSWTTEKKVKKSKAYVEINAYDDDWREPETSGTATQPNVESSTSQKPRAPKKSQEIPPIGEATSIEGYKKVGPQAGSQTGALFEAPDGQQWYVKAPSTVTHGVNEVIANRLYMMAGVNVPLVEEVKFNGQLPSSSGYGIKSKIVEGTKDLPQLIKDPKFKEKLYEDFAVDAWLANWDVIGLSYDNIIADKDGNPVRIDGGGSLLFRAKGMKKGSAFGTDVVEINTLRDPKINPQSAKIYADITDDDIRKGVAKIAAITPEQIDKLIEDSGLGSSNAYHLAETLKARRQNLLDKYSISVPTAKPQSVAPTPEPAITDSNAKKTYTQIQKIQAQSVFLKHNIKWYNDTKKIYDAAQEVSLKYPDLTMADALDIMDQSLKKKSGNPFRTKVEKFLKTNAGKKYAQSKGGSAPTGSKTSTETPSVDTLNAGSWSEPKRLTRTSAGALQTRMDVATPPPWTPEQKAALRTYTGSAYHSINKCLRGLQPCENYTLDGIERIKAAMKPTTDPITVFRKTNPNAFGLSSSKDLKDLIGKTIKDDGIISTSIRSDVWGGDLALEIEVPRGAKIAWVQPISMHPDEDEIILAPGTHYEVVSYDSPAYDGGPHKVKLRVIPGSDATTKALTAAGDFDESVHPRDGRGRFAKKAGGVVAGKKTKITHRLVHKKHEPGTTQEAFDYVRFREVKLSDDTTL